MCVVRRPSPLSFVVGLSFTAYAESGDRPCITVFEWPTFKRKKYISNLDVGSSQFVHLSFTNDGRNLLVQGGAPEWTLVYLNWEKAKVVASVKASNAQGAMVHQVEANPSDSSVVCVVADGLLKLYKVQDNALKPIPLNFKRDPQNYLCMTWLPDDRMVVATDTGELLLFEANEFRTVLITSPSDGNSIDSIIPFTKGFLVGCNDSVLRVYERSDDRDFYKNPKKFKVAKNTARILVRAAATAGTAAVCVGLLRGGVSMLTLSRWSLACHCTVCCACCLECRTWPLALLRTLLPVHLLIIKRFSWPLATAKCCAWRR